MNHVDTLQSDTKYHNTVFRRRCSNVSMIARNVLPLSNDPSHLNVATDTGTDRYRPQKHLEHIKIK